MRDQAPDRDRLLTSWVEALRALQGTFRTVTTWDAPTPCAEWTLLDLSGHLLAIARYWHRLLDAAESGQPFLELPRAGELAVMNRRDLSDFADLAGPRRVHLFMESAVEYLRRIGSGDWSLTLGEWSGLGALTVGEHSGVANGEWHVHAWDVARSIGADHRPSDAEVVKQGNEVLGDVPNRGDPWIAVLVAYGRDPAWVSIL